MVLKNILQLRYTNDLTCININLHPNHCTLSFSNILPALSGFEQPLICLTNRKCEMIRFHSISALQKTLQLIYTSPLHPQFTDDLLAPCPVIVYIGA